MNRTFKTVYNRKDKNLERGIGTGERARENGRRQRGSERESQKGHSPVDADGGTGAEYRAACDGGYV